MVALQCWITDSTKTCPPRGMGEGERQEKKIQVFPLLREFSVFSVTIEFDKAIT